MLTTLFKKASLYDRYVIVGYDHEKAKTSAIKNTSLSAAAGLLLLTFGSAIMPLGAALLASTFVTASLNSGLAWRQIEKDSRTPGKLHQDYPAYTPHKYRDPSFSK
jgi:hypothetical protein